jgi:thymidylate synthase (FAD)
MTTAAQLDVQLIAHTLFQPPVDSEGRPIFEPDPANDLDEPIVGYDGSALAEFAGRACYQAFDRKRAETATNAGYLLNILKQKHGSVLEHASVSFYLQGISRSLLAEITRHRHFSFSVLSQRFVDSKDAKAVIPPAMIDIFAKWWHENMAEGEKTIPHPETGEPMDFDEYLLHAQDLVAEEMIGSAIEEYVSSQEDLIEHEPTLTRKQRFECARAVLPNGIETKMVITGNYRAWIEFLVKRENPAADAEIRRLAVEIGKQLAESAPNVFGPEARKVWDFEAAQGESSQ